MKKKAFHVTIKLSESDYAINAHNLTCEAQPKPWKQELQTWTVDTEQETYRL